MLRRAVSATLILSMFSFSPAFAQQAVHASQASAALASAELVHSDAAPGDIALETKIDLRPTLRLLREPGRQLEKRALLGFEPATTSLGNRAPSSAVSAAAADGALGMRWWTWALIGAGIAVAATQIEFGGDDDEDEDDDD